VEEEEEVKVEEEVWVPDEEVGMGGPEGRVYWPPGMEEWLRPKKREIKKKDPASGPAKKDKTPKKSNGVKAEVEVEAVRQIRDEEEEVEAHADKKKRKPTAVKKAKTIKQESVPTPSTSEEDDEVADFSEEEATAATQSKMGSKAVKGSRQSKRASKASYAEVEESD